MRVSPTQTATEPEPQTHRPRPLDVALRVLLRVEDGAYSNLALSAEFAKTHLPDAERALATELCYGTLRQWHRIERALAAQTPRGLKALDPTAHTLLRLGAYQLLFMKAQPHFVVDAVVQAVKKRRGAALAGFVNAVLRKLATQGEPALPPYPVLKSGSDVNKAVAALALHHGLPRFWVAQFVAALPNMDEAQAFFQAMNEPASTWLRLNPLKGSLEQALEALRREVSEPPKQHPIQTDAVELVGGHPFAGPAYGRGLFTAQDLSAQWVTRFLLSPTESGPLVLPPGPILDACAGVGGKTCHLAALLHNEREIDAVDILPRKLELLSDHAHRLGCKGIRPVCGDLLDERAPIRSEYAAVLLDAPCSGSGVLRRHPEARLRTPKLDELVALQARLLDRAAALVAPSGVLVYSVCSLFLSEGPEQIAAFCARHHDFVPLPPSPDDPLFRAGPQPLCEKHAPFSFRTFPHRHNADGFYVARLRRSCPVKQPE
ncbi:MAG TPA: transcription antitermination factor NusB [Pseudomonadota bacterium]|nr:transcription antitermination factor NusB [Pseudomonadota bacterium]